MLQIRFRIFFPPFRSLVSLSAVRFFIFSRLAFERLPFLHFNIRRYFLLSYQSDAAPKGK